LHIPREYINKEVEVIILPTFTADKSVHMPDADQFDPSLYFGAAEALKSDIDSYLMDIRGEW
jgi:hypothetical protein